MSGRYAPSPTSGLHLGNLRTALVAWLFARSTGRDFRLRIEDLDQERIRAATDIAASQLADLAELGIDFDGEVIWQSARTKHYERIAESLSDQLYECFCTRREIAESVSAPHWDGYRPYLGTCRNLTPAERAERRKIRPGAWRIKASNATCSITDFWAGEITGQVDDFVIRRNDGVWSYNFVVVVDDIAQGVDQVVRGADLLSCSPRQAWLSKLLGGNIPSYAHVPLVVDAAGERLAKREKAITLADFKQRGVSAAQLLSILAHSLGLADVGEPVETKVLLDRFNPNLIPRAPWSFA